jgi:hypothetical protein
MTVMLSGRNAEAYSGPYPCSQIARRRDELRKTLDLVHGSSRAVMRAGMSVAYPPQWRMYDEASWSIVQ